MQQRAHRQRRTRTVGRALISRGVIVLAVVGCGVDGAGVGGGDALGADAAGGSDVVGSRGGGDATGPGDVVTADAADGAASCVPSCPHVACGADDGCGGLCPACPTEQSCEECPLRLHIVERDDPFLSVAVDFAPLEGAALPTLADLRLRVEGDATLLGIEVGEAVLAADKAPFPDPRTGEPFQVDGLGDGVQLVRVVLGSIASTSTVGAGHWLTWRFRLGGAFTPLDAPVVMGLLTDEAVLAPPAAEQQLWGTGIEGALAVWPAD